MIKIKGEFSLNGVEANYLLQMHRKSWTKKLPGPIIWKGRQKLRNVHLWYSMILCSYLQSDGWVPEDLSEASQGLNFLLMPVVPGLLEKAAKRRQKLTMVDKCFLSKVMVPMKVTCSYVLRVHCIKNWFLSMNSLFRICVCSSHAATYFVRMSLLRDSDHEYE